MAVKSFSVSKMLHEMNFLTLTVLVLLFDINYATQDDPYLTFDRLYTSGISAYTDGKYHRCVMYLEKALEDYKFYKHSIVECRVRCKEEADISEKKKQFYSYDLKNLDFFSRTIVESRCVRSCHSSILGERPGHRVTDEIQRDFETRQPYNYLQYCYFKMKRYNDAVSAAYTFFLKNPDHQDIINNIREYRRKYKIKDEEIEDLERKPYKVLRLRGEKAYDEERWNDVIENFEEGLKEYYLEDEMCRAECEDYYDHEGFPNFINAIAGKGPNMKQNLGDMKIYSPEASNVPCGFSKDHYVSVLKCQSKCEDKLSRLYLESIPNFLPDYYNYLQFAYFKTEQYDMSVEAIASYLLMEQDEEMLKNKAYFMQKLGYHEAHFVPREQLAEYVERVKKMEEMMNYVETKYSSDGEIDEDGEDDAERYFDTEDEEYDVLNKMDEGSVGNDTEPYMKVFEALGIKLLGYQEDLKGARYAAAGFFREDQCLELVFLANVQKPNENGVRELTIPQALEIVKNDADYEISLRMFLKACEVTRFFTARYFNLTNFFVKNAKLVCYDPGLSENKEDCIFQESGVCLTDPDTVLTPGEEEEDFVGVGYITDNKDSNIYFMDARSRRQSEVKIKCGHLVGFRASDRHGITKSDSQRCAVVVTYTKNRVEDYTVIRETMATLHKMDQKRENKNEVNNTKVLTELKKQGIEIVMTGEELKGKERFVADGLAEEGQCLTLVDLAKTSGVKGDGYKKVTPHTKHEIFSGTDVERAAESGAVIGDGYEDKGHSDIINISPHTDHETFEGLTVQRAQKLAVSQTIPKEKVELYLNVSEKGRLLVEKYFNLTRPLYFDYTHLVCRTAIEGDDVDRSQDLSHPVHADNCQLKPDGSCPRKFPSYVQRDYSAILYLNDNFEGGEFFFAHSNKSEQVKLKPKCGRIVGFSAGEFHGVKAVLKGQRCAVAMWYTLDPNYKEVARVQAWKLLSKIPDHKAKKPVATSTEANSDTDEDLVHEEL